MVYIRDDVLTRLYRVPLHTKSARKRSTKWKTENKQALTLNCHLFILWNKESRDAKLTWHESSKPTRTRTKISTIKVSCPEILVCRIRADR